jgi:hypothetical protein
MERDNSSYTVTSPDLLLTDDGMTVMISSTNEYFIDNVKLLFEKYVYTSIIFKVQPKVTNENTLPWMWYVSRSCDVMIIDLDTCAWVDICTALLKEIDENHIVVFYSEKYKKREVVRLINATSSYMVLRSIDELDEYIKIEMKYNGAHE